VPKIILFKEIYVKKNLEESKEKKY